MTYSSQYSNILKTSSVWFLHHKSIYFIQCERFKSRSPHRRKVQHRNLPCWRQQDMIISSQFLRNAFIIRIQRILNQKVKVSRILWIRKADMCVLPESASTWPPFLSDDTTRQDSDTPHGIPPQRKVLLSTLLWGNESYDKIIHYLTLIHMSMSTLILWRSRQKRGNIAKCFNFCGVICQNGDKFPSPTESCIGFLWFFIFFNETSVIVIIDV